MVLIEAAVIIGVVIYYRKRKQQKLARTAAWESGNPYVERDGSLTYPPPAYSTVVGGGVRLSGDDNKVQREYYGAGGESPEYTSRDGAPVFGGKGNAGVVDEKKGAQVETKEIQVL